LLLLPLLLHQQPRLQLRQGHLHRFLPQQVRRRRPRIFTILYSLGILKGG
jgi:hypothetical protein